MAKARIVKAVPITVLEVLSPEDRIGDTLERYRDYARVGVANIVQMDPERYVAHRFDSGSLIETKFRELYLPHIGQSFDSDALLEQSRREIDESAL